MLPIQSKNEFRPAERALAARRQGAIRPQADLTACQDLCSDRPTEASYRICIAACTQS